MKLDSKECKQVLKNYEVKNEIERLAVEVLLTKDEDVVNIPGIEDMNDEQIDELTNVIGAIRRDICIEEEA